MAVMTKSEKYFLMIVLLNIIMFIGFYNVGKLDRKSLIRTRNHLHSFGTLNNRNKKRHVSDAESSIDDGTAPSNIMRSTDGSISYKVPAFMILGVMKGGSTNLTSLLQTHPLIPKQKKELHFFDLEMHEENIQSYHDFYFNKKSDKLKIKISTSELMTFDATPSYFTLTYIVPSVKRLCPWVKMIVILRNPVDRLFSQFKHLVRTRKKYCRMTFEKYIEKDIEELSKLKLISKVGSDIDTHNDAAWEEYIDGKKFVDKELHLNISVARGLYYLQLRQWFKYFPKSSFLVLNFDEMVSKDGYQSMYNKATKFLGLNNTQRQSSSEVKKYQNPDIKMNDDTKKMLYDLYALHNRELSTLLGDEWDGVWEYKDQIQTS